MDSHEKLGTLLSEYLSSQQDVKKNPTDVLQSFHFLGLTEFASKEHVDETYHEKCRELETDMMNSGNSRFSREFMAQQKKELDDAYSLITAWLSDKS
ncbi:MAG: hypothetical protein KBT02_02745 [Treponema sp.]|nr:hypothetical protein [Candidatus Treponema caballi]